MNKLNIQEQRDLNYFYHQYQDAYQNIHNKYTEKSAIMRDPQCSKLIDAFAFLNAYQDFQSSYKLSQAHQSLLENISDKLFVYTECFSIKMTPTKNIKVTKDTVLEAESILSSIHEIYLSCIDLNKIDFLYEDHRWFMKINIDVKNPNNLKGITFHTTSNILSNIFQCNRNISVKILDEHQFFSSHAQAYIPYDHIKLENFLHAPQTQSLFHISNFSKNLIKGSLNILIPVKNSFLCNIFDFKNNQVWFKNQFDYSPSPLYLDGPGCYEIVCEKHNYEILKIQNIIFEEKSLVSSREKYKGWYITCNQDKWYVNIQENLHGMCHINLLVSSNTVTCQGPINLQVYHPTQIKYEGIKIEKFSLLKDGLMPKILPVINKEKESTLHYLFEFIKLFPNYVSMIYTNQKISLITMKKFKGLSLPTLVNNHQVSCSVQNYIWYNLIQTEYENMSHSAGKIIWS